MGKLVLVPARGPRVVQEGSVYYFRSLTDEELKREVRSLFRGVDDGVWHTTATIRSRLLPALIALRERTARGKWEETCRGLGLSSVLVRQWCHRERHSANLIARLLGEPLVSPPRPKKLRSPCETTAVSLARAGLRMANALRAGNLRYALRLAREYEEACRELWWA